MGNVRFGWRVQRVTATPLQSIGRGFEAQGLSRALIEPQRDPVEVGLGEAREIGSLREVLAQQAVGVLVAAALPRTAWIAEVDLHVGGNGEALVVSHLLAAIPGQGAAQFLGQFAHVLGERGHHGRRILAWHLEKHHKAGMALDKRRDVRVVRSREKVSFPMAWHGAILGLGRPLADGNRIDDLSQSALRGAAFGLAHLPRCTQVRHQLLLQHATRLNEEAAVDRFVRYLHVLVGRELLL